MSFFSRPVEGDTLSKVPVFSEDAETMVLMGEGVGFEAGSVVK